MIDDLEGDIGEPEKEADRKVREFRQLHEAKAAIDQRLESAAERSAFDAWRRLIAKPNLMHVAQALGDSAETMKHWLVETCDTVSDEVTDPRVSASAVRRLKSTFIEVAHLYDWTLEHR